MNITANFMLRRTEFFLTIQNYQRDALNLLEPEFYI